MYKIVQNFIRNLLIALLPKIILGILVRGFKYTKKEVLTIKIYAYISSPICYSKPLIDSNIATSNSD